MCTIKCDEEYKGNEYTYSSIHMAWYCSSSPSWRYRNMRAYRKLESMLTRKAIDEGWNPEIFSPPKVERKKAKKRNPKKPDNFISLFD